MRATEFSVIGVIFVALAAVSAGEVHRVQAAEGPVEKPLENRGRFTMTPVEGGLMRLDTETGAVSLCVRKAEAWSCEPVNDPTASSGGAQAKLEAENRQLRERIKSLENNQASGTPQSQPLPPPAEGYPSEPPGGVTKLPSEEDVDKALDYVERIFKKFRDRIKKYDEPGAPPKPGSEPQREPGGSSSGGGAL